MPHCGDRDLHITWGKCPGIDHLGDPGMDGRIILNGSGRNKV
jgi:hypothetical protein